MKGSIHHDRHGYKVHFKGRWFRRIKLNNQWISFGESYKLAEDFLVLVNAADLRGEYDPRDYTSDEPLAFDTLAGHWLETKTGKVRSFRSLYTHIRKAIDYFRDRNIKNIHYADLQDFYLSLPDELTEKTKKNYLTTLSTFWTWMVDREQDKKNPLSMPKFPGVEKYKPALKKILSLEDQAKVLARLQEIASEKVYIGTLWCITYCLRFEELRQLKLKDFDNGYMTVWDWKQESYKKKKMLPEDWAIVEEEKKKRFGNDYFFMNRKGQFGKDYLSEKIKKVARDLGFYDVTPYAIVKHSTITALSDHYSPEEIKKYFSLHLSPALYNYLHLKDEKKMEMYARARGKITQLKGDKHGKSNRS